MHAVQDHYADPILDSMDGREIIIDNRDNSNAHEDYQVALEIEKGHLFFAEQDSLQFVDENLKIIDHWNESFPDAEWLEVLKIPSSGMCALRMLDGNPSVSSKSNPINTLEFFDDFTHDEVYSLADKWTTIAGTPTISNEKLYLDDGERIKTKTWTGNTIAIRWKATHPNETGSPVCAMAGLYDNINKECTFLTESDWDVRSRTAAGNEKTTIGAYNGEHVFEIKKNAGSEAKYYVDNVLKDTDSTYVPDANIPILLLKLGANDLIFDWVFAHKYSSPEPTAEIGMMV